MRHEHQIGKQSTHLDNARLARVFRDLQRRQETPHLLRLLGPSSAYLCTPPEVECLCSSCL